MLKQLILLLALSGPCLAQNALVVELTPDDVKTARALDQEQKDLKNRQEAFENKIYHDYLVDTVGTTACTHINSYFDSGCYHFQGDKYYYSFKTGWSYGFEYSSDFRFIVPKFIVPKTSIEQYQLPHCYYYNSTCYIGTCATQTSPVILGDPNSFITGSPINFTPTLNTKSDIKSTVK